MSVNRITFERVALRFSKSGRCPKCGKSIRRSITMDETLNPWNKNAHGLPKSRAEIYESLRVKGDAWKAQPAQHDWDCQA